MITLAVACGGDSDDNSQAADDSLEEAIAPAVADCEEHFEPPIGGAGLTDKGDQCEKVAQALASFGEAAGCDASIFDFHFIPLVDHSDLSVLLTYGPIDAGCDYSDDDVRLLEAAELPGIEDLSSIPDALVSEWSSYCSGLISNTDYASGCRANPGVLRDLVEEADCEHKFSTWIVAVDALRYSADDPGPGDAHASQALEAIEADCSDEDVLAEYRSEHDWLE